MMAMVKLVVLLLVVFKATALENSSELSSYSSPSPLSYPDVEQEKISKALCIAGCAFTCIGKPSFFKGICMGVCVAKCVFNPSDFSLDEATCTVDCAQSSANSLPYDANMMNDIGLSCYQQCKKN